MKQQQKRATGIEERQFRFVLVGSLITFTLLIVFNFVFPTFLDNAQFVPLGAVFIFPFAIFTAYAIIKHHFLNVKIFTTEILAFILATVTLFQVTLSGNITQLIVRFTIFMLVLVFGILLIRSVMKEVKAREEIERLAKDLAKANEQLKELDQRKSEFVSLASHQLRSPLTAIKGYASMLLEGSFGDLTPKVSDVVGRVYHSSQRLVVIIEDFLTISRIEQNRLKYDFQTVDLKKIVKTTVEDMQKTAQSKDLKLSFECSKTDMYHMTADIGKITQVVGNLIDNAIKYTQKGYVKTILTKNNEKNTVRLVIQDSGIGMSGNTIERLFQKFSRAKDANKIYVSGTGLGLYVAYQIVQAHHGKIWAESLGEGKGSTFYVELPAEE